MDLNAISRTVAPGDAFFDYVNEGWLRTAVAPAGYGEYGEMQAMFLRTEAAVKGIIQRKAKNDAGQKLGDLYASFLDTAAIERAGLTPIQPGLDAIAAIKDHAGVAAFMARPMSHSIVGSYVFLDAANTRRSLLHLDQQVLGPRLLGLPTANHYSASGGDYSDLRSAYRAHITRMLGLAKVSDDPRCADAVVALETRLASVQWTGEQLRDRRLNYHLMRRADLETYAPGFDWSAFLLARGFPAVETVVLNTDTAIRASAAIFAETPVPVWQSYLAFHWIQNHAYLLPAAVQETSFDFYGRRLAKQETQRSRESRGVQFVSRNLPDLIGKAYVVGRFLPAYRVAIMGMAINLKRAFAKRLANAEWLDLQTRTTALAKIDKMALKLGYPDNLRDYAETRIVPTDPIGNLHRLQASQAARDIVQLAQPERPYPWHLAPQTVDGSYSPQLNAICFPAGILQAPAFSPSSDPAVNFGAIGAVLGHEMAHGFDDQGSHFDDEGNLRDWWTPASRAAFERRAAALVAQYDSYEPLPGLRINGRQTLGENLADLVGVTLALDAFRLYAAEHSIDLTRRIDGFTAEQRFFLGWAQFWRTIETDTALRSHVQQNYHSPARYRVNGVVRNLDAWYNAFGVTANHDLYLPPERRVRIW
ncbi:M13 family metallopeptidase [Sphingomonas floccifaciens]|uniref:M13 family metallopeptidase n=1 Tax=Sphingomonas floccifaciens TaxID=1844115 RepID=A0ABW4NDZ1_9SPHN